jgi:DNA primase
MLPTNLGVAIPGTPTILTKYISFSLNRIKGLEAKVERLEKGEEEKTNHAAALKHYQKIGPLLRAKSQKLESQLHTQETQKAPKSTRAQQGTAQSSESTPAKQATNESSKSSPQSKPPSKMPTKPTATIPETPASNNVSYATRWLLTCKSMASSSEHGMSTAICPFGRWKGYTQIFRNPSIRPYVMGEV